MKKYTIGIDFGTLSGRCLLVDLQSGEEVALSVSEYKHKVMDEKLDDGTPLQVDWALQDPQDYVDVLTTTIKDVIAIANISPEQIVGVGIDFTSCTMLPILEDGTPLCKLPEFKSEPNAYVKLWKHHAAQSYADKLNELAEKRGESFLNRYGGKISSEWMFPKIMQILDESPDAYNRTYAFVEAVDWIGMLLTGKLVRSGSAAGFKSIWSDKDGFPSKDFFKELDPRLENIIEEKFKGDVQMVGTRAGTVNEKWAKKTGLAKGTAVSVGHLDAGGAVLGAGIITTNKMLIVMGTSSCHILLGDKEIEVPGICGMVKDGIVPGFMGYEAGQSCVGDGFQWFVDNCVPYEYIKEAEDKGINIHQYLSNKANKKLPGESGIIALDWLNGNRSVLVDGKLSGVFVGCSLQTKPEDMYRALVEATAFGTRLIIDTFSEYGVLVDEVVMAGGIAMKNPFIMQMYSDVLGKDIKIAGSSENSALSVAIWAALAAGKSEGGFDDFEEATSIMSNQSKVVYTPNKEYKENYDFLYEEYITLHDYFGRGENNVMKRLKDLVEKQKEKRIEKGVL